MNVVGGEITIGYVISKKRESKGLSQETLAELAGTSREYISRLENDKAKEDPVTIYNIGKVFKCAHIKRYALGLQVEPIQVIAG